MEVRDSARGVSNFESWAAPLKNIALPSPAVTYPSAHRLSVSAGRNGHNGKESGRQKSKRAYLIDNNLRGRPAGTILDRGESASLAASGGKDGVQGRKMRKLRMGSMQAGAGSDRAGAANGGFDTRVEA